MEKFVVSARKYRPHSFNDVLGQTHVTTTLKNAIKTNHLAHAFLFCGPKGVGKTTSARILAKAINCQQLTADTEPCDVCISCKSFNEHTSFNIYELDAASNNSVEDIRSLVDQIRYPPQQGAYKIYIIDEVHMLSQAAFNAFLKTLEEPPKYVIFILATTEKHKVLPTILSRCQIFDFQRIKPETIVQQLKSVANQEDIPYEEEALHLISLKSDGALRDALSMFDVIASFGAGKVTYEAALANLHVLDYSYYFKLTEAFLQGDINRCLLAYEEIVRSGFDGLYFLEGLIGHFRSLLVSQDPETLQLLEVAPSIQEKYRLQAQQTSPSFLLNALQLANACAIQYKDSLNKRFHVELMLIELATRGVMPPEKRTSFPEKDTPGSSQNNAPSSSQNNVSDALQKNISDSSEKNISGLSEENVPDSSKKTTPSSSQNAQNNAPSLLQNNGATTDANQVVTSTQAETSQPKVSIKEKEETINSATQAETPKPKAAIKEKEEMTSSTQANEIANAGLQADPKVPQNATTTDTNQVDALMQAETPKPKVAIKEKEKMTSSTQANEVRNAGPQATSSTTKTGSLQATIKIPNLDQIKAHIDQAITTDIPNTPNTNAVNSEITQETIAKYWQDYAKQLKAAKKIPAYNLMNQPIELEGNSILIKFSNAIEEHILSEIKEDLINYLRNHLQAPWIDIKAIFTANSPIPQKPYTAQEKFHHLVKKNPHLQSLKDQLRLEIKS
ncbi:MAG: DNA polymerase III subunit gamma/tau [Bacteroidota bacterium]